jgi:hypothetical protein
MSFSGSATLAKLRSLQAGVSGALHAVAGVFSGSDTLRPAGASGTLGDAGDFAGDAALAALEMTSGDLGVPGFFSGAAALEALGLVGLLTEPDRGLPVRIVNVTGLARASGGCLLEFDGPPNRGVEWSITAGSGAVAPLTDNDGNPMDFTDKYGRAFARYDAGGYSGPLSVQVEYGT